MFGVGLDVGSGNLEHTALEAYVPRHSFEGTSMIQGT